MQMEQLTVATANTHESRMLRDSSGLVPFTERHVDVLLLQEVLGMARSEVETRLASDGFRLQHYAGEMGLAIALSTDASERFTTHSNTTEHIHQPTVIESVLKKLQPNSHRLRQRGIIATTIQSETTQPIQIANTHPIVFVRAVSRRRQIQAIANTLDGNQRAQNRLILGGDMNHYPGPQNIDTWMQNILGLNRAVHDRKSWPIRGSKHEWMARIGMVATRNMGSFDADLDAILFKGVAEQKTAIVDIASDHRAVITTFGV